MQCMGRNNGHDNHFMRLIYWANSIPGKVSVLPTNKVIIKWITYLTSSPENFSLELKKEKKHTPQFDFVFLTTRTASTAQFSETVLERYQHRFGAFWISQTICKTNLFNIRCFRVLCLFFDTFLNSSLIISI